MFIQIVKRTGLIMGTALMGVFSLTFVGIADASAHVSVDPESAAAGSHTVLTFSVPHGCEDSPTVKVAIQLPTGISAATPTRNAFYTVEKVLEELDPGILDSHGREVSVRISQVVYHATNPLPADQRDTFSIALELPADSAGSTLYFPTVQTCEEGEIAWVQVPTDGQDPHSLAYPSPSLVVTAASEHHHGAGEDLEHVTASDQTPLILTSLAIGAAGLLLGLVALIRGARRA